MLVVIVFLAKMRLVFSIFFFFFHLFFILDVEKESSLKKKEKSCHCVVMVSWYLKLKTCYFFQ